MIKKFLSLAAISIFLFSCSSDDDSTTAIYETDYSDGIFIVNEGNFGTPNASVSSVSADLTNVSNNIFQNANNGRALGDVAQSMTFSGDYAYIVVNSSNVVEVVNKHDFTSIATISEEMSSPRYAVVENNKLYVTQMATQAKKVTVYNATTFEYIQSIDLGFQPELIVEENDKIYVSANTFSTSNKLAIINPTTDTVEETLTFDAAINGLTTGNDQVFVLTTNASETIISKIENNVVTTASTHNVGNARYLEFDTNKLYFTSNLNIYEVATTANANATVLFTVTDNSWSSLYGFEVFDGRIFTSDAKAFTEDGVITIYNTAGTILKTFRSGVGPNGFYKD